MTFARPSERFYVELPDREWTSLYREENLRPVPADWALVVTDLPGSRSLIRRGRYKDVNDITSLTVMALANELDSLQFPFLFGGDGLTALVPPSVAEGVGDLLASVQHWVGEYYGLKLRAAVFPVGRLYDQGLKLRCGAFRVSPHYRQAALMGDALDWTQAALKRGEGPYVVHPRLVKPPRFQGYSCVWKDYPSPLGETVALVVSARRSGAWDRVVAVLKEMRLDSPEHHPLRPRNTRPVLNRRQLRTETQILSGNTRGLRAAAARAVIRLRTLAAFTLSRLGLRIRAGAVDASQVLEENVCSSDVKKWENALKMVVALTPAERARLQEVLEDLHKAGWIFWGIHISDRAHLTCLVRFQDAQQVHFVDAAEGGYASAVEQLERQQKGQR